MPTKRHVLMFSLLVAFACAGVRAESGASILSKTSTKGGIVVCVGADNPELLVGLAPDKRFLVHCIDSDVGKVENARQYLRSKGLYGQISVDMFDGKKLPYTDNLVNLVVLSSAAVSDAEVNRVLCPLGTSYKEDQTSVKPWPNDIKEWTHWLQGPENNAVSGSRLTEQPRHFQWIQDPLWIRHHNLNPGLSALVSAQGRIFYILDEAPSGTAGPDQWKLIARDAFNGTLLWKIPIKDWGWKFWLDQDENGAAARFKNPHQVLRRLVAIDDKVFVTLGIYSPVQMLDAATGEVLRTYKGTEKTYEIVYKDGMLVLAANKTLDDPTVKPAVSVMGVDATTCEILWERGGYKGVAPKVDTLERYVDTSLTCGDNQAFIVDQSHIVGIDARTGEERWRVARPPRNADNPVPRERYQYQYYYPDLPALVYDDGILFFSQILDTKSNLSTRGIKSAVLYGIDTKTGKNLWEFQCDTWAHFTPPDVFVIQGLVWTLERASDSYVGLDPRTGEKKRSVNVDTVVMASGHHNCYRNKASERFLYTGKEKGNDLINLETGKWTRHNWVKGACRYGIMPANGMLYFPSHNCRCYMTTKLNGFFALSPLPVEKIEPSTSKDLQKGPAYNTTTLSGEEIPADSWPVFRHDNLRTDTATTVVPTQLSQKWSAKIGGSLTQPVVVGDYVFVSDTESHELFCLDRNSGNNVWRFVAGGKIDSSPSWYKGLLVFGSRDGHIYCLDAATGQLAWKFRAAPIDLRIAAFGQLEATWPTFGSQLLQDGKVYCCAGRSMNLSTGVYVYSLDVKTGEVLLSKNIAADIETDREVNNSVQTDILVGDEDYLVMRGFMMNTGDFSVESKHTWNPKQKQKDPVKSLYVKSYAGFLDNTWFNDSYLMHIDRPHAGHLLNVDSEADFIYAHQGYRKYNDGGSFGEDVLRVGQTSYGLFSGSIDALRSGAYSKSNARNLPGSKNVSIISAEKIGEIKPHPGGWSTRIPIRGFALVGDKATLFLAGVEDKLAGEDDPWKYLQGRAGGVLTAFSKDTGKRLFTHELKSAPCFDGMSAAYGNLFISLKDGTILCLGKRQ